MGLLSVCPSMRIDLSFTVLRISMTLPRTTSPSGFTSALPESKRIASTMLTVSLPLDPDRSVVHRLEDLDDLAEDYEPVGLHFRLARIEEDRFDHVDGELAL